ncbi:MAG: type II toxin-antitoxin system VapC family toxin [Chloroflexi bacterium]|nr:type II toxin-antitoxin system VapC family toxin [Chloroflexota bacterium]
MLDTNVVSEIRKPLANENVKAWFATVRGSDLFLSVLVIGEIRSGIERLRRRDHGQASLYEEWLAHLHDDYVDRILPITVAVADVWGRINVPNRVPVIDGLLAATAIAGNLVLVTRNVVDLAPTGAKLLDLFEPLLSSGHRTRSSGQTYD